MSDQAPAKMETRVKSCPLIVKATPSDADGTRRAVSESSPPSTVQDNLSKGARHSVDLILYGIISEIVSEDSLNDSDQTMTSDSDNDAYVEKEHPLRFWSHFGVLTGVALGVITAVLLHR